VRRIKQKKRIIILRDDHIGDPIGGMFLDPSVENADSILERLCEYLGHRVRILRADLTNERAEVEVELQEHADESSRLAAAARDLSRKGARRNAVSMFREALELDPLNRDAAMGFGVLLAELQEYGEALRMLKRARESGPDDVELLFALGRVCIMVERTASAITYLERAFELDPGHFGVSRALAELGRKPKPAARPRQIHPAPEGKTGRKQGGEKP
jgi:tetratricopeptide (TPR) repeat protein